MYRTPRWRARAFRVTPDKPRGVVLVVHEVWGFNSYIQDICRRVASLEYSALAPLLYWSDEGTLFEPETIQQAMRVVWDLSLPERYDRSKLLAAIKEGSASEETARLLNTLYDRDFRAKMLHDMESITESATSEGLPAGAIGFSMGGGLALWLAARSKRLRACIVFSAEPPETETIAIISSPILAFYGSDDSFMTRDVPRFVRDVLETRKELTLKTYPSAGHEFFDSTNSGHEPNAASDSWEISARFLKSKLEER
jgi:carboxymethylenebutenolidase